MTVAIIGAGLTGVCTALRLAEAGVDVHLFDRARQPLLGASGRNEGKLHLGYVYAMDRSLKTARMMLEGAAAFRQKLAPWVGPGFFERHGSDPFLYVVPNDSMLDAEGVRAHFDAVSGMAEALDLDGRGARRLRTRELGEDEIASRFAPDRIVAAFETEEIAVDPLAVRAVLLDALAAQRGITLRLGATVLSFGEAPGGYVVLGRTPDGSFRERYATIVNAAWEQRAWLDASLRRAPQRPLIHRYKCGLRTRDRRVIAALPTVTFLVGEYGDTVAYRDGAYASWYPKGLLRQEVGLRPRDPDFEVRATRARRIAHDMLEGLAELMPGASAALDPAIADWTVVGGYITAWGDSGIDDAESELHDRYEIGVTSRGGHHSIDTGKYTTAPLFAAKAAARIIGDAAWSVA